MFDALGLERLERCAALLDIGLVNRDEGPVQGEARVELAAAVAAFEVAH